MFDFIRRFSRLVGLLFSSPTSLEDIYKKRRDAAIAEFREYLKLAGSISGVLWKIKVAGVAPEHQIRALDSLIVWGNMLVNSASNTPTKEINTLLKLYTSTKVLESDLERFKEHLLDLFDHLGKADAIKS